MIGRYRSPAGRTRWLTLLPGLTVVLAILPLPAQSPAGKPMGTDALAAEADEESKRAATTAMLPWLALEDRGDYGATWDQASRGFRDAEKRDDWIAVSKKVRPPLGKCLGRTLASANHQTDIPLAGGTIQKGEYVVAQFDASFENLKYAVETVCFQKEADGTWRASGYFIKPKA